MSDMAHEQIEREFRRQVKLCSGLGPERMRQIIDELGPSATHSAPKVVASWDGKDYASPECDAWSVPEWVRKMYGNKPRRAVPSDWRVRRSEARVTARSIPELPITYP